VAIFDRLPLEAVEEENDGHNQGCNDAPRHGPIMVWPEKYSDSGIFLGGKSKII
jgi:hypothetical protein